MRSKPRRHDPTESFCTKPLAEYEAWLDRAIKNIHADEIGKFRRNNSIGAWVDSDPWSIDDYVEIHKAKKELQNLGKPISPEWVRWMREVMKTQESNHYRKHSGKPLKTLPSPPSKSK